MAESRHIGMARLMLPWQPQEFKKIEDGEDKIFLLLPVFGFFGPGFNGLRHPVRAKHENPVERKSRCEINPATDRGKRQRECDR